MEKKLTKVLSKHTIHVKLHIYCTTTINQGSFRFCNSFVLLNIPTSSFLLIKRYTDFNKVYGQVISELEPKKISLVVLLVFIDLLRKYIHERNTN